MFYKIIIIILIILFIYLFKKNKIIEGFDYGNCINSGYTKEFCIQTPTSTYGPNSCLCSNGNLGYKLPGYGGQCVCNLPSFTHIYRPIYSPESASF